MVFLSSGRPALAQEGGEGEEPMPLEDCAECHVDIEAEWQGSAHARAFEDPLFQDALAEADHPDECLACHTTGFEAITGEYSAENVTCEACHGLTPAEHPPEVVHVRTDSELCGACHEQTYDEWNRSAHAAENVQCMDRHTAHGRALRFVVSQENCLSCHDERLDDFAHVSHAEANLACVDCHIYRDPDAPIPATGLADTSHEFGSPTQGCLRCHENLEEVDIEATPTVAPATGSEADLRIAELEAELAAIENCQGVPGWLLLQGILLGGVLGAGATWMWLRVRRTPKE